MKTFKKRLLLALGVALVLFMIVLGCTKPDFRTFSNPMMTTGDMEVELARLHEINLTADSGEDGGHIEGFCRGLGGTFEKLFLRKLQC